MMLVIKAGDSLTDFQRLLYLQIMVVMACSLIQTGGTPSQMFSGYYLQDPDPRLVLEVSLLVVLYN